MSDRKCARALVKAAKLDLRALQGMTDKEAFPGEIAGFHAQQAAEKLLKAWIAAYGLVFPLTHDLGALLEILQGHERDAGRFHGLLGLNPFAVQFRYESISEGSEPLDRDGLIASIQALLGRVESTLGELDTE